MDKVTEMRQATQAEIHAQQAKSHQDQAQRHAAAAQFLHEHPDFVKFLELLKTGIFA